MKPLLEDEVQVFEDRYNKSASALIAISQTLEKKRPLSGNEQEFLDLFDLALAADPESFTKVWLDPSSYFWTRVAFELLGSSISGEPLPSRAEKFCQAIEQSDPVKALSQHLHSFKSFILGIQYLEGKDVVFSTPIILSLPYSIPGTFYSLEGEGQIEVSKLLSGNLIGTHNSQPLEIKLHPGSTCASGEISVSQCPVLTPLDCEIILKPQTFTNLPSLDFVQPAIEAGLKFQLDQEKIINECMEIMEKYHAETFHLIKKNKLWVVLISPSSAQGYSNCTYSELPLSFMASVINNPFEMADAFIHEFHHNRLFFLEENGAFLDSTNSNPLTDNIYYSPWRTDSRPLQGILHALYVYIPVAEFWQNVVETNKASQQQLAYARYQLLSSYLRMTIGLFQLNRFATFTDIGKIVFVKLSKAVDEVGERIKSSRLSYGIPSMICHENGDISQRTSKNTNRNLNIAEDILNHLEQYAPTEQKPALLKEQFIIDLQQYIPAS
jgi:hypothetical protein